MTKKVPLERLRHMTKQRSIRGPSLPARSEAEAQRSADDEDGGTPDT